MPRVLIAESLHLPTIQEWVREGKIEYWEGVAASMPSSNAIRLEYCPEISPEELPQAIAPFDALVVRPKEVTAQTIAAAPNLKLIVRGGAGLNSIDQKAAAQRNIQVKNTPGENRIATAEFTFGLLFELLTHRHIQRAHNDVITGRTEKPERYEGQELCGKNLGIMGLGYIGKELAQRARAFGMKIFATSRSLTPKQAEEWGVQYVENKEKLASLPLHALCLHMPLTSETEEGLNDEWFARIPNSLMLINTARPQLIHAPSLARALETNRVSCFAIDGDLDLLAPFLAFPKELRERGLFTHHIADTTEESITNITRQVLRHLEEYFGKTASRYTARDSRVG